MAVAEGNPVSDFCRLELLEILAEWLEAGRPAGNFVRRNSRGVVS